MSRILTVTMLLVFSVALRGEDPWARTYGSTLDDRLYALLQTGDGGCLAVGKTTVSDAQGSDALCIKTDSAGKVVWQKSYGGKSEDKFEDLVQLKDGSVLVGGSTGSCGPGKTNVWLSKMSSNGTLTWQREYGIKTITGGYVEFRLWGLILTRENDYFIYGERKLTFSSSIWYTEAWCGRLRQDGSVLWSYVYGPGTYNTFRDAQQTSDGGFILEGDTGSLDGTETFWNPFIVRITPAGVVEWASEYDWNKADYGSGGIRQTPDGGYILAGHTWLDTYNSDVWLIKTDSQGAIEWQKGFGRTKSDGIYSLQLAEDGGFVMVCMSDIPSGVREDIVYLKTDSNGKPIVQHSYAWKAAGKYDSGYYPWHLVQTSEAGYFIVGFGHKNFIGDAFILRRTASGAICPSVTSKAKLSDKKAKFVPKPITLNGQKNAFSVTKAKLNAAAAKLTETNLCSARAQE